MSTVAPPTTLGDLPDTGFCWADGHPAQGECRMPVWIDCHPDLDTDDARWYRCVSTFCDSRAESPGGYATVKQIANRFGRSPTQARRRLHKLEKVGALRIEPRYINGRQRSNIYRLAGIVPFAEGVSSGVADFSWEQGCHADSPLMNLDPEMSEADVAGRLRGRELRTVARHVATMATALWEESGSDRVAADCLSEALKERGLYPPDWMPDSNSRIYALSYRDGWTCHYCNTLLGWGHPNVSHPEVEHKIPRSLGGTNDLENLVLACGPCNQSKGTKTHDVFCTRCPESTLATIFSIMDDMVAEGWSPSLAPKE